MLRTKPEDSSENRTLALSFNPHTLAAQISVNGRDHAFHLSHCIDENEERVPRSQTPMVLAACLPSSYVSIITAEDLEVRVVLDFALIHGWSLFEVFGKMEDTAENRKVRIDMDRWTCSTRHHNDDDSLSLSLSSI